MKIKIAIMSRLFELASVNDHGSHSHSRAYICNDNHPMHFFIYIFLGHVVRTRFCIRYRFGGHLQFLIGLFAVIVRLFKLS